MLPDLFEGFYYKHQMGGETLALIPGHANGEAFIQVITGERSYHVPARAYSREGHTIRVDGSVFSPRGVRLDIHGGGLDLAGEIDYRGPTPLERDVMGPLRFLPLECRHSVVSMHHDLAGSVRLDGRTLNFTGGRGYIEGDSGSAFPSGYCWAHSGDFSRRCSVMACAARLPVLGLKIWGCLAIVWLDGVVYRLATYKGARILARERNRLDLMQGKFRLVISRMTEEEEAEPETREGIGIPGGTHAADKKEKPEGHPLYAPRGGTMGRVVYEQPACRVRFQFYDDDRLLLGEVSEHASYEFAGEEDAEDSVTTEGH